ncbi:hypothetical protein DKY63_08125 [Pseudomonas putida]|uniref:Uncharacterized protein n=1 Tax=Pseudomonas putida TaxID=303 RepID=A0A2Z4RHW9_PSEPU|nr:hypothetical protein DKY63_08125 [Pseudomonas putida]
MIEVIANIDGIDMAGGLPLVALMMPPVGASLLAMVVNDNAGYLDKRGVLESIASMLAPTGGIAVRPLITLRINSCASPHRYHLCRSLIQWTNRFCMSDGAGDLS